MAKVAKETGVATQMGNQGRSSEGHPPDRRVDLGRRDRRGARGARLGRRRAAGTNGRGRPQGDAAGPIGVELGPVARPEPSASVQPRYAPFNWRGCWAFGGGGLADMAPHNIDPAVQRAHARAPETVEATGPERRSGDVCSTGVLATYRFGRSRGASPPVTLTGTTAACGRRRRRGSIPTTRDSGWARAATASSSSARRGSSPAPAGRGMPRLLPLELHREYKRPEKTLARVEGHHADWLPACKGGAPASSDFSYSTRLTEFLLLGNVALRARR